MAVYGITTEQHRQAKIDSGQSEVDMGKQYTANYALPGQRFIESGIRLSRSCLAIEREVRDLNDHQWPIKDVNANLALAVMHLEDAKERLRKAVRAVESDVFEAKQRVKGVG